jgi:proteasome assembly chaperone (PAC2) family protein
MSDPGPETDDELGIERLVAEPVLHEPVLVVMLTGWIDATGAAATAAEALADACETSPVVRFDDDMYIDYRARRPVMELRDGLNTDLVWSTIELRAGQMANGRDLLILTGPEPDMAWRRFGRAITTLSTEYGVTQMVAFGAYPFAAPHTRPPRLSVSSPSTDVLATVEFARSSVDVPAGMAASLEHAMHAAKIPALGIWAQVPHYVSGMSYPASSIALLDGFAQVTGIEVDTPELRDDVAAVRQRIDDLVDGNSEHESMLRQLEEIHDAADEADDATADPELEMRSGDELAAEIQRFLRDQN